MESNKLKNKIIYCKSFTEYEILGLLSTGATIYIDCFKNDFDDMLKSMISFFKLNKQILYKRKNRLQVYDATFDGWEDEYKKYRSDICEDNAMYLIKANAPINTEAHSITQTWLNANKIQFLIDERVAK